MQLQKADIVLSVSGHDKGKLFFILAIVEGFCLLANGKEGRRVDRPKRKSVKHLQFVDRYDCETARKLQSGLSVENYELRRDLAIFCESRQIPRG